MNIVCVSHLRWDFVFQRPQHLLTRAAREGRVWYIEEPVFGDGPARLEVTARDAGLHVVVPRLPPGFEPGAQTALQRELIGELIRTQAGPDFVLWYYTPMALPFMHHLRAAAVVYDCMDELSGFAGAPKQLRDLESALFDDADVVFTGGHSLYEAKRQRHANVHAFPSSVDVAHFARARRHAFDPADQASIPRARLGFYGVIDERMDYELIEGVAAARPDWHLVMIGPTAKIDPGSLPRAANIHYLGPKTYPELPAYVGGWDVAILPFARNDATRFISPTKTPEYLAAGKPVVSTSIRDVIRPYGQQGLARIADSVRDFVGAVESALKDDLVERVKAADAFLANMSWDGTWARMRRLIEQVVAKRGAPPAVPSLASAT